MGISGKKISAEEKSRIQILLVELRWSIRRVAKLLDRSTNTVLKFSPKRQEALRRKAARRAAKDSAKVVGASERASGATSRGVGPGESILKNLEGAR